MFEPVGCAYLLRSGQNRQVIDGTGVEAVLVGLGVRVLDVDVQRSPREPRRGEAARVGSPRDLRRLVDHGPRDVGPGSGRAERPLELEIVAVVIVRSPTLEMQLVGGSGGGVVELPEIGERRAVVAGGPFLERFGGLGRLLVGGLGSGGGPG